MMRSILIVEDDITFGMMLKTWLGKKGFEVSSVSTIARARKHIESGRNQRSPALCWQQNIRDEPR